MTTVPQNQPSIVFEQDKVAASIKLACGPIAHQIEVAYECVGPKSAPLILVMGGISSHRSATSYAERGWWSSVAGTEGTLNPQRYRLLGIDFLGGLGGSTAFGDLAPDFDSPFLTTQDQARAVYAVIKALGVSQIDTWVGCSFGGMVGLSFASLFPHAVKRVVAVSAAHRSTPHAMALRWIQQTIARETSANETALPLSLARALAMTTYRTPSELNRRFSSDSVEHDRQAITSYLNYCGQQFSKRFSVEQFTQLSDAIDRHFVDPQSIRVPVSFIGVEEDQLVPIQQLRSLINEINAEADMYEFSSMYGHDAFLKEPETLNAILKHIICPNPNTVFRGIRHWRQHDC